MEVSNNSDTDPCAWVGVVDKIPPAGKTIKVGSLICRRFGCPCPHPLTWSTDKLLYVPLHRSNTPSTILQTSGSRLVAG